MRYTLFIIFCTISFTASAQFWKRKHKRLPLLTEVNAHSAISFTNTINLHIEDVNYLQLPSNKYSLELAEDWMMTEAKHNMRYRIYNLASYNFSDLAALYVQQNRFSEAKWYLLQSNAISRRQDNTKLTLANLLVLSAIKVQIGELALAKIDLQEARDIATTKGMQTDLAEIEKRIQYLQSNKIVSAKAVIRYAESVEAANAKAE